MNENAKISPFSNDAFIEQTLKKSHSLIRDVMKENIAKYNFKIQFYEQTWVLKQEGGGIDGHYNTKAALLEPMPFGVISVSRDKKLGCSTIHVWSDGACDGNNCYLINVPNGLFKEIHGENDES